MEAIASGRLVSLLENRTLLDRPVERPVVGPGPTATGPNVWSLLAVALLL
jgi:hypothetical protein